MNVWISLLALAVFIAALTRNDWRRKREKTAVDTDPRMIACMVEHQAKLDLLMTGTRALLRTHPNGPDVAVVLRAAATHLSASSARDLPDTHGIYEAALRATLEQLVGE